MKVACNSLSFGGIVARFNFPSEILRKLHKPKSGCSPASLKKAECMGRLMGEGVGEPEHRLGTMNPYSVSSVLLGEKAKNLCGVGWGKNCMAAFKMFLRSSKLFILALAKHN